MGGDGCYWCGGQSCRQCSACDKRFCRKHGTECDECLERRCLECLNVFNEVKAVCSACA